MIKQNKKIQKESSISQLINFPNQINAFTILLIIIIYSATLYFVGRAIYPQYDYMIRYNYPQGTYNSEINPFVFIRGTAVDTKPEEDIVDIKLEYRIFAYINSNVAVNRPTNVRYSYSGVDKTGAMHYFFETSRKGVSLPVSHYVVASAITVGGDEFEEYFIRVRYNVNVNNVIETKEIKLSQQVLELKKRELNSSKFENNSRLEDILNVSFTFKDEVTHYGTNIRVNIDNFNIPYQINLQSWIVTEDDQIFPFLGLYNYGSKANFQPWHNTTVWKYIKPKEIYMKLQYIDEDNVVTYMYYRTTVAELLTN